MPKVYSIDGITPVVDPSVYVHPAAVLIGDVIVGARVYIGPAACLRGDFGHIGHGAVLHGCRVRTNAMVGINAVVNDNAEVGESSIVAAMAFVKAEFVVPPRSLAAGVPARILRPLTDTEMAWKRDATRQYQELSVRSLSSMRETTALTEVEPGRRRHAAENVMPLSVFKQQGGI
jgi:phenylacetic acid degradation protein